ncbi:hypothetical protein AALO_G00047740 [Alosa alosa]|uniref:Uncharacterized protein n=1 Tax=Alosa alosa TaxID=278164 RepID=A0AAV6H7T3_9TELE|nr:hypothetical protein AALO_G00047740 [Alosa alosa]
MVCGVSLSLLVSCVLLSLVILYRKRTAAGKTQDESFDPVTPESPASQAVDGDGDVHLYAGVCDPDPGQHSVQDAELTELYFLLQPPDSPAGGQDELYSLVAPSLTRQRPLQDLPLTDQTAPPTGSAPD